MLRRSDHYTLAAFLVPVFLAVAGLLATAQPATAQVDLTRTAWRISAIDEAGTSWGNSILVFQKQTFNGADYDLKGYVNWVDSNGTSGQELFTGNYDALTGRLVFAGYQINNPVGPIITGTYRADVLPDGSAIINGSWNEGVPGVWSARPFPGSSDLTCELVKWENIIPGIVGWPENDPLANPSQREVAGGWAVNLTAVATVLVRNAGSMDAPASTLVIKLKKDGHTAVLQSQAVKSLQASESVELFVQLQFNQGWDFVGDAEVIAEADGDGKITEGDETNNTGRHLILIADPRPDRWVDKIFPMRKDAVNYIERLGFFEDRVLGFPVGWAKYLQGDDKIRSRRDGEFKPARAFRMDAVIIAHPDGGFAVAFQGKPDFGEPNPNFPGDWFSRLDYVRWWHITADY